MVRLSVPFLFLFSVAGDSCNHLTGTLDPQQPFKSSVHYQCDQLEDGTCKPSSPDSFTETELRNLVQNVSMFVPSLTRSKVDASTIHNKVLAGYQGWAMGSDHGWWHWANGGTPSSSNAHFELLPELGEYPSGGLFSTHLKYLGNGSTVKLYGNDKNGVVDLHFKWMADYGMDGVLLQRFTEEIGDTSSTVFKVRNTVMAHMDAAATKHGRTWAMMYDMSSTYHADDIIKSDWKKYVAKYTSNPQYLREKGKPVVCVFGIGLSDHVKYLSPSASLSLIHWLQGQGLYVIGSGPYYWRGGGHDAASGYSSVHAAFDAIMPWSVGRYNSVSDFNHLHSSIDADAKLTSSRNQGYAPIAYPGYSFRKHGNFNKIKRNAGQFFQAQIDKFLGTKGVTFYYIAMWDEVQEGTAIYKTARNQAESAAPKKCFVSCDMEGTSCGGDHYLKMTGQFTARAHGHPSPSPRPNPSPRPSPSPPSPTPVSGDALSRGDTLSAGGHLTSNNGKGRLVVQGGDGNVVLYANGRAVWTTSTSGYPGAHLTFQGNDGNLVVYDVNGKARWASGHHSDGRRAMVTNDCNFVVVDGSSKVVWSTGTSCSSVIVV